MENKLKPIIKRTIFRTRDYSKFKFLHGNRDFEEHGKKLLESVRRHGIINPIVVNERMEIIDGQGRLYAAMQLGIEVPYIVVEGVGINECLDVNRTQTNWKLHDYINSFADRGFSDYVFLRQAMQEHPAIPKETLCFTISGFNTYNAKKISSGNFNVYDGKDKAKIKEGLDFLDEIISSKNIEKNIPGRKARFYIALLYSFGTDNFNKQRMKHALEKHIQNPDICIPFNTVSAAIRSIEKTYNYGMVSDKKINLVGAHTEAVQKGLTWWGAKVRGGENNGH